MRNAAAATPDRKDESETTESRAGSLRLLGGALCLDFANTASGRGGSHRIEHLRRYEHLLLWSRHAGLLSERDARQLRRAAVRAPAAAERALARAKNLRDAIFTVCSALGQARPAPAPALATLNRAIVGAAGQRRLVASDGNFAWQWTDRPGDLGGVLRPIALSAADLLLTLDRRRLKQCPGDHCGWLFLDETRSRTRRWCEMRVCGSRAKVRRFRRRRGRRVGSPGKS
jgi:predicted RNA-binding Zn ribbon-like protein